MKLTVIAGPTASGKSALALELAERSGAEIVSADSQQVYRYFDIGTAKPTAAEHARVPHHCVSIVEPEETFSAAHFQRHADAAIADIQARGKRVFVVGGSGLYLRVLLHGVVDAPPADAALRASLTAEAETHGRLHLHARLATVDPLTAARLSPNDLVRVIRALEIHALTGTRPSALYADHAFAADRYDYELYALAPDRVALYAAINARTKQLFERGLLEETRALVERGFRGTAPMRSVGYRQALDAVEGRSTPAAAESSTAQETRHFAKRQRTWLKKEARARFVVPDASGYYVLPP